jgi:hypothetical protein
MRVFNKKTTQHSITLMLVLLGTGYNLNAEVYRWKDSKGVTHYSDRPPSAITKKKSDELLLKIIKSDNYCANPNTTKAEIAPIDFSNSYFFNVVNARLNQQQFPGIGSIATTNLANRNLANRATPNVSSGAAAQSTTASASRSATPVTNATRPAPSIARPAATFWQPSNTGFLPFSFNTITRATPFGVSVANIGLPKAVPVPTAAVVNTPTQPSALPKTTQTDTSSSTSTSALPSNNNIIVATSASTSLPQNNGSSLLPVVDLSKTPSGDAGYNTLRIKAATHDGVHNDGLGAFRTVCAITHYSNDDPILFPGVKGAAHHHTFFGNTAANFATTPSSILTTGNSSCDGGTANRTGYWIPSLIDTSTGAPLKPFRGIIYYKMGKVPGKFIQPFPKHLRMIAGNANAKVESESSADFACVNESAKNYLTGVGKVIPACAKSTTGRIVDGYIRLKVEFPNCWDGKNLDSPDHKSHMAYANGGHKDAKGNWYYPENKCPTTHPIPVPQVTEIFDFEVTDAVNGTNKWRLASDNYPTTTRGGLSLHADWMNGWDESIMNRIVKNCLNKSIDCGMNYLGDGQALY